jgi:large subunit ribosomal protein L7e
LLGRFEGLSDYIAYGFISKRSVIELVHRRAFTNYKGSKQPLSDNVIVETLLGDKGILCLNDLSDEIFNVGPNFHAANEVFSAFKLSSPTGSYEKKILNVQDEVEQKGGFLGEDMDKFLDKIL